MPNKVLDAIMGSCVADALGVLASRYMVGLYKAFSQLLSFIRKHRNSS